MLIVKYARRNVQRQHGRSLLTGVAMVMAVALVIVGTTLIDGMWAHIVEEYIVHTGHVRVRHPSYDKLSRFEPLEYTVGGLGRRIADLEAIPGVVRVLPRLRFGVMLQYTDLSTVVPESAGKDE